MLNQLKKDRGFTLIEIVLVLAIAGLILVIVFLAVAGAQRSRRDTQRKNDNARILSQFESYASNNGGAYPTSWTNPATWRAQYIDSLTLRDPSTGLAYTFDAGYAACGANDRGHVRFQLRPGSPRTVDLRMCLEAGFQDLTNS